MFWRPSTYRPINDESTITASNDENTKSVTLLWTLYILIILLVGAPLSYWIRPSRSTNLRVSLDGLVKDGDRVYIHIDNTNYWRVDSSSNAIFPFKAAVITTGMFEIVLIRETRRWGLKSALNGRFVIIKSNHELALSNFVNSRDINNLFYIEAVSSGGVPDLISAQAPRIRSTKKGSMVVEDLTDIAPLIMKRVTQYRGVNIGGWFIPERWMSPSFYDGVSLYWSQLCGIVEELGREVADSRMQDHLKTWFTQQDFDILQSKGVGSIRVPLGYWNLIEDPYKKFIPIDLSISLNYIDWLFDEAEKRGMTVMLDLHGGPGSQNGWDHSGCGYDGPTWVLKENRDLSLDAIRALISRYGSRKSLIAIEILNEPSGAVESGYHDELKEYYEAAYTIIRENNAEVAIIFAVLFPEDYDRWSMELREPEFYNVIQDMHLYNMNPDGLVSPSMIATDQKKIDVYSRYHPIVVGEWAAAQSRNTFEVARQDYVDSLILSYAKAWGWYMWNFKVPNDPYMSAWSLEHMVVHPGINFDFSATN